MQIRKTTEGLQANVMQQALRPQGIAHLQTTAAQQLVYKFCCLALGLCCPHIWLKMQ